MTVHVDSWEFLFSLSWSIVCRDCADLKVMGAVSYRHGEAKYGLMASLVDQPSGCSFTECLFEWPQQLCLASDQTQFPPVSFEVVISSHLSASLSTDFNLGLLQAFPEASVRVFGSCIPYIFFPYVSWYTNFQVMFKCSSLFLFVFVNFTLIFMFFVFQV